MNKEIKDMDKRLNVDKARIEIVCILSKYEISIGDVDLVFDLVKNVVNGETKIHIS